VKESCQRLLNHFYYEIFLGIISLMTSILAILSLTHAQEPWSPLVQTADYFVSLIFAIDYVSRLYLSEQKWKFMCTHILEFIAIIPFSAFQAFRLLRLLSLVRAIILFKFMFRNLETFFVTYRLIYIGTLTMIILVISAAAMYVLEHTVNPQLHYFTDALWWSFVTATTVGYGDIFPVTTTGRLIAVLLMSFGIGLLGVFVGTITTFIVKRDNQRENPGIQSIIDRVRRLNELNKEDVVNLQQDLMFEWRRLAKKKLKRN
jgi:voltage-gated potassium channel